MSLIQRYPEKVQAAVNFYGPTNLVHMYEMWAPAERPILGDVVGGDRGSPDEAPEHAPAELAQSASRVAIWHVLHSAEKSAAAVSEAAHGAAHASLSVPAGLAVQ